MSKVGISVPTTRAELIAMNEGLDRALIAHIDVTDAGVAEIVPQQDEWSLSQQYSHLAEFPHFFADQLRRWHDDPEAIIGRTMEHPVRLAAVEHSSVSLPILRSRVAQAFEDLARALALLSDSDIISPTRNVKYGAELMTAFLDRYVIGHKSAHLDQIEKTKRHLSELS